MSLPRPNQGPSSSLDNTASITTASNNSTPAKPGRPQLERPKSSPSAGLPFALTHRPALSSSSSSVASSTAGSSNTNPSTSAGSRRAAGIAKARRPPNAGFPSTSRPKTAYQAVTWKENLDAFNRRLRRGSLSLDAAAQEEEEEEEQQLLAAEAVSSQKQSQAHQLQQLQLQRQEQVHEQQLQQQHLDQTEQVQQAGADAAMSSEPNECTRLLGRVGNTRTARADPADHTASSSSHSSLHAATVASKLRGAICALGDVLGLTVPSRVLNAADEGAGGQSHPRPSSEPVFPTQLNPVLATTKSSKLGVFSGVFVPCVLSIWGIILFLRFGFIIGQAGVMGTMAMFVVGYLINIFTTLSLSAISTNGTVRGGGVYYLVSRSLGPEFGGSIGLIYFLCTVVGCGMNVLGFVEPLIANFGEISGTVYRVLPESPLWGFIYGTMLLVSCTLVCLVGSKLFARSSLVLAVVILLSTLSIFVSFALMPPFTHPERNIEYTGFSWDTLQENMWPQFTTTNGPEGTKQSFQTVFGVLFPACIGILAGASMSGDLEDPSKSIPKGTLWAVGSTFCVYTFIVVLMGGSISRSSMYTDLSILQDVSVSPMFIASGALAASVFATLGSVIGAAKILQAIARDNLLPLLAMFGQGTPKTDEPTLAVLVTYILCQFCLFLTDMNAIATFVSLITLLTYLILNLACFLLKIGSAPNFRPSFRFFHWWTAFAGMILCALVMGFVDLGQSLLSGLMTAVLFIWIHYWSPPKRWGDVTQSLIYHQVRKYLLRLDSRKEHVKFWRPQILLLVHHPRSEFHLIQFCNHLKKGALYVLGHVIAGDLRDVLHEYRRQQNSWLKFVDVLQLKAFVNLSVADSVRIGARNLLIGTGLGGMRPNIVVLGSFNLQRYLREKQEQQERLEQEERRLQVEDIPQPHPPPLKTPDLKSGPFGPHSTTTMNNNSHTDHTLLNIPVSLPIDNIRVESSIKITEYISIIEDVLSLNKAVAIGYGFERLELPEEHKTNWKQMFSFGSELIPSTSAPTSRASSLHKHGERKKKKYIDLWPMQMSITPLQCYDPQHQHQRQQYSGQRQSFSGTKRMSRELSSSPHMAPGGGPALSDTFGPAAGAAANNRVGEPNLTNFDTYAMVLQMGCILHMVPQWKDNCLLRVMVFVEYKEDVEEEKKRLNALLENLRIPAEVKVICLDGGDSETYERLVKGHYSGETANEMDEGEFFSDEYDAMPAVLGQDEDEVAQLHDQQQEQEQRQASISLPSPAAQRLGPRNMNPLWLQQVPPPLTEQEEDDDVDAEGHLLSSSMSGHIKSASTPSSAATKPARLHYAPVFQPSGPAPQPLVPQRRSTISHPNHPPPQLLPHRQQSPGALRVNTALSPRIRQGFPVAVASTHRSSSNAGLRFRSTHAGSLSPKESRLGTSVPSMSFRIAVPLPRQYFDPRNGNNSLSNSDTDSTSSEDDDDYDHNDDDLVFGGTSHHLLQQQHQQQSQYLSPAAQELYQQRLPPPPSQQTPGSAFVHTSLGSEQQLQQQQQQQQQQQLGLGIALGSNMTDSQQHTIDVGQLSPYSQQRQTGQFSHTTFDSATPLTSGPWLTSDSHRGASRPLPLPLEGRHHDPEGAVSYTMSPLEGNAFSPPLHPSSPFGSVASSGGEGGDGREEGEVSQFGPQGPASPLQFDHLVPEAQLMILNELMRIHSSAETTSIVFTTVPAPEEGTSLREESSLAYLEKLDLLMDGIDVPVLLLHAKSLTVTMTL
ncbi:hypothetical protein EDD11_010332 [Mortierella claussenii]|nr:hypothetical protein EDD11_010332 [Mortierella claussenii]